MSTGMTESFVYESVKSGELKVADDGSVWRVAQRRNNRWNKTVNLFEVKPHRVDQTMSAGYRIVKVMRNLRQVTTGAHRLVFLHFFGNIPLGITINHKNGDKCDNRPCNLELATYAQQAKHATEILGHMPKNQNGEMNRMAKLTEESIHVIRRRREAGEKLNDIAKGFSVSESAISKIARGESWIHIIDTP
jgi:hypothetical protein